MKIIKETNIKRFYTLVISYEVYETEPVGTFKQFPRNGQESGLRLDLITLKVMISTENATLF